MLTQVVHSYTSVFKYRCIMYIMNRRDCYTWRDNWISRPSVDEEEDGGRFRWASDFEVSSYSVTAIRKLLLNPECVHIVV